MAPKTLIVLHAVLFWIYGLLNFTFKHNFIAKYSRKGQVISVEAVFHFSISKKCDTAQNR